MDQSNRPETKRTVNNKDAPDEETIGLSFVSSTIPPTEIGRYRVVRVLGQGGFGIVLLAEDSQLNRQVAIKLPHRNVLSCDTASYLEEARIVASLDHEHIVPVYDVGSAESHPFYIVSKYIDGTTLGAQMRAQRLRPEQACDVLATMAEALHYAHQRGLVHRDVKPGNILIGLDTKPYLVDFGLALRDDKFGTGPVCAGTPAYMSPEQARGEGHRVDGRSDVFSLGIVFYEMLTGQRPFRGSNYSEILQQVQGHEPKPPRQFDDRISRELERICSRAMEKQASNRYLTALDFADDLRHALSHRHALSSSSPQDRLQSINSRDSRSTGDELHREVPASGETSAAGKASADDGTDLPLSAGHPSERQLHIVPKGLRSFDSHDADFFLSLLPGPLDRNGLPDGIRFWKTLIEESDPKNTFQVGLIYGPSGCGKSSLVRAGLLPRLIHQIDTVYVEASLGETEARLLLGLRKRCPTLPDSMSLKGALTAIRRGQYLPSSQKLLIVLDQFEQWLNTPRDLAESELVQALRQCDGGRVQCLLLVRDDFWMSVSRFMKAMEIRLQEGQNSAAVDLFDKDHAAKVLRAFGIAFGRLPLRFSEMTADQKLFLKTAIEGLTREGRIICVRLAVFAEMMKSRPWTPTTLREVGGAQGLGVNFLEETFNGPSAPPERRYHQAGARAVLRSLLPDALSDIKGYMRSEEELMQACGYRDREADFEELISILDGSLRLISPTDMSLTTDGSGGNPVSESKCYQLSHDYLVPSLRSWLTRKQQETKRGRAELLLTQRSEMWNARHEVKQLPSLPEWLRILFWTQRQNRSEPEQRMLRSATKQHSRNLGIAGLMIIAVTCAALFTRSVLKNQHQRELASSWVDALQAADVSEVPAMLLDFEKFKADADSILRRHLQDENAEPRTKLNSSLALLKGDPSQQKYLLTRALHAAPDELLLIRDTLRSASIEPSPMLWKFVDSSGVTDDERFRALCSLAQADTKNSRWQQLAPFLAEQLVTQTSLSFALKWSDALRPVQSWLIAPLAAVFRNAESTDTQRTVAVSILADYGKNDFGMLTSLLVDAKPQQFAILIPALRQDSGKSIELLQQQLKKVPVVVWKDGPSDRFPDAEKNDVLALERADGLLFENYAFCQKLRFADFSGLAESLKQSGYRPICFRPFFSEGAMYVAAIWNRDGRDWRVNEGATAEAIREEDEALRLAGMWPVDVAHFRALTPDGETRDQFSALWSAKWPEIDDARMYVGVLEEDHPASWGPLVSNSFSNHTGLKVRDVHGSDRYSSVRWKLWNEPRCHDEWNDPESQYVHNAAQGWTQSDVRVSIDPADGSPRFSATWWDGSDYETQELHGLSVSDHLEKCRMLSTRGFRPWSISVDTVHKGILAASVWARPIDEDELDHVAVQKAISAIGLVHLGRVDELWPLLRNSTDPSLRAILIDRLAQYDCPVDKLLDRLDSESDVAVRRALLLSLTSFDADKPSTVQVNDALPMLQHLYLSDSDPGVHSAADLLLRRWGHAELLAALDKELKEQPSADRNWIADAQGHTLAIVRGPVEFQMGSLPHTVGRNNYREMRHKKRIGRSYAIATREVTVEQFQRFQPEIAYSYNVSRTSQCPINGVDWLDAARYCRWLSEVEGISEAEMCYPPLSEIKIGMRLPSNYLSRTGYRLPTEAEWEYACRAGTDTEHFFGQSDFLLDKHAWTFRNSAVGGQYQLWPVASLRPNDLGLFDILGNTMEWCQDPSSQYPEAGADSAVDDSDSNLLIKNDLMLPVRGGAFLYQPSNARAGHRDNDRYPENRFSSPYLGFRVARTINEKP